MAVIVIVSSRAIPLLLFNKRIPMAIRFSL
jgi:hypothetical protein